MRRSQLQAGQANQTNQAGFTLVELIVVLIVISIMAYVAIPRFALMMGFSDIGYRDQVAAAIGYARKIAVAQRRHTCVVIAASSVTVNIDPGLPQSHATNVCPAALTLPTGANVISAPSGLTSSTATLDFDAEGRPVSGAPATITFTGASGTSTLTIEAESGYVH